MMLVLVTQILILGRQDQPLVLLMMFTGKLGINDYIGVPRPIHGLLFMNLILIRILLLLLVVAISLIRPEYMESRASLVFQIFQVHGVVL
jgi:hypothetical protein